MLINNKTAAMRVRRPTRINIPKAIPIMPTKGLIKCEAGLMGQGKRIWNFLDIRAAEKARDCLNSASHSVDCSHIALKKADFRIEKLADAA